ncbi:MAG: VIT and VWA domain-containing protein, partial [Planctomycetota bacterium]|nr:VIT and VWA domain-containing protein [Planctomycetota bacterium]
MWQRQVRRQIGLLNWLCLLLCCLSAQMAYGQGLLINVEPDHHIRLPRPLPHPQPDAIGSYTVTSIDIDVSLKDQVAQTTVSQTFKNTGQRTLEVCFWFPLPPDSTVDQLTLMVNGKELPGKIMKSDEARSLYEAIVRKNQDPALLEWMGSGLFKTSVFPVPAGESRTVVLHYSQICRTLHGVSDYLLPLTTARYTERPIEKFSLTVHLTSSADLKNIYSPNHQVSVERDGARRAKVTYQRQQWIPDSDFRLLFDAGDGPVSGKLLSYRAEKDDQGYFAFFAPPDLPQTAVAPVSKTVLLVVDRSGSMSGQKMEQARESLRFVLNHLHDGDLFNVIAYDSVVESFRAELQRYGDSTREEAIGFVNGLHAGGSTNINGALQAALSQLHDKQQPTYIVFLTDGIPTVGPTSVAEIAKNAQAANQVRARMFCFGVGYDVNSRLLDRLSRDNFGNTSFVRPNEQIEGAVSKLYEQIESPVLTNAKLYVASPERAVEQGASIDRMYPGSPFDLFAGQQLMVVGRSRITGDATLVIEGQVNGTAKRYEFPVHFSDAFTDSTNSFVARLWAIRRVGDLL